MADAAKVSKRGFELCNDNDPLYNATIGPTYFNVTSSGDHFFISTLHDNCLQGMKLAINATALANHIEHGRGSPSPTLSPASPPSPGVTSAGAAGSLASLPPALTGGREEPQGKSSTASFTVTFYIIFSSVAAFFFCQI